jgi:hypothetical protein
VALGLTNRLIRIAANVGNAGFVPSKKRWKVSKRWYSENGDICINLVNRCKRRGFYHFAVLEAPSFAL